ncbi:MAG TPA: hypothetical protein VFH89_09040 [Sphingomicrobium sp.]|nr:hypothetical protein [Sphingomicrobium sp.]
MASELIAETGDVRRRRNGSLLTVVERSGVAPLNSRIDRPFFGRHHELIRKWVGLAGVTGKRQQKAAQANRQLVPHEPCVATDAPLSQWQEWVESCH